MAAPPGAQKSEVDQEVLKAAALVAIWIVGARCCSQLLASVGCTVQRIRSKRDMQMMISHEGGASYGNVNPACVNMSAVKGVNTQTFAANFSLSIGSITAAFIVTPTASGAFKRDMHMACRTIKFLQCLTVAQYQCTHKAKHACNLVLQAPHIHFCHVGQHLQKPYASQHGYYQVYLSDTKCNSTSLHPPA